MEIIEEGIKFFKGSKQLDHYLKIYYKKSPKIRIKVEKTGNEKAIALLKEIDSNINSLKSIKSELAKLENKFATVKSKEEKAKLKEKYKKVFNDNKPLIKKMVRQADKLNHSSLKTALAGAGIYYLVNIIYGINKTMEGLQGAFNEYMDDLKFDKYNMGPGISASTITEATNYFPY